jgi:phage FluMu protein Com
MNFVAFLAQQKKPEPTTAFGLGEIIFYGFIAILVVVLVVSGVIVREAHKKNYVNAGAVGLLLFGSVLAPLILLQLTAAGFVEPGLMQPVVMIGGVVAWIGTLLWYTVVSSQMKRQDEEAKAAAQDQTYNDPEASAKYAERVGAAQPSLEADVEADVIDAEELQPTPRRAVTLPAADSDDSARPSEQTLKRMSAAQIEEVASTPKPPRASEIPENPILPDEIVKIRCKDCDKKMKAEGAKFMKQRRCPACKAEPFRYAIIEQGT